MTSIFEQYGITTEEYDAETCTCQAPGSPTFEGPEQDCPVHGDSRLFSALVTSATKEIQRLGEAPDLEAAYRELVGEELNAAAILARLVDLKDGPRGHEYFANKEAAWAEARALLRRAAPQAPVPVTPVLKGVGRE